MKPSNLVRTWAVRRSSMVTRPVVRMVRERSRNSAVASFTPMSCCRCGDIETPPEAVVVVSSAYCGTSFIPQSGATPG